jgi:hypothetical protein
MGMQIEKMAYLAPVLGVCALLFAFTLFRRFQSKMKARTV